MTNPAWGDFSLSATSPNIDRGVLIPGINDNYFGSAPDIGAFESPYGTAGPTATPMLDVSTPIPDAPTPPPVVTDTPAPVVPPVVTSISGADALSTNADFVRYALDFSKDVSGVDAGDFILSTSGNLANASITEISGSGSAYMVTVNTGSGDGTLRLDLTDNDSIIDAMSTPLGGVGISNGNFAGDTYTINRSAPYVTSILRADPDPTSADTARFTVAFSESVFGVDAADFVLAASGLSDAGLLSITGSGSIYTVVVKTGSGNGSLRLDLFDDDSIVDAMGAPLGGAGIGNANFASGETYTIDRNTPVIYSAVFYSDGADDGWILESKETSNRGGTVNSRSATLRVGDNAQDNQYRSILQFPTESMPDNAVIKQAILTLQLETIVGKNPFVSHRYIWIDIREGAFGSFGPFQIGSLQNSDFQASASLYSAGIILDNPVGGWYWSNLDARSFPFINLQGVTQFRLGFLVDDDDNRRDDYLSFFSGDYGVLYARPQLTIKYYVP
ncbi:MAG: hypothetical protein KDD72_06135 [Anaerolineales bacterium]|nr:hypothetical protein [Anaerolineales bacterium]